MEQLANEFFGPRRREQIVGVGLKMFLGYEETVDRLRELAAHSGELTHVGLFVLPSYPVLAEARRVLGGAGIAYGAQDGHWEDSGAHTGSVSPAMLRELGCAFMEIGHAERRRWFGEDDEMVARKVAAAVRNSLVPIVCVGEADETCDAAAVAVAQTEAALSLVPPDAPVIVAYEPVWAIGGAAPADVGRVADVVSALRSSASHQPKATRILYGGSVAPGTIRPLLRTGIEGVFVGRAATEFVRLRRIVAEVEEAA